MDNTRVASAAAELNWVPRPTGRPIVRPIGKSAPFRTVTEAPAPLLTVSPRGIARTLLFITGALVAASVAGQLTRYLTSHRSLHGLIDFVSLDAERNLPTFYSGLLLLFASSLLGAVAVLRTRERAPFARQWLVLAAGFLFMTADEWLSFHEALVEPVQQLASGMQLPGIFTFAWVLPGIVLVGLIGVSYFRFLRHLPEPTRRLFLFAGALYLGGAIGCELVGGAYASTHGLDNLSYNLIATIEESLEMLGIITLSYALLRYIGAAYDGMRLGFTPAE